MNFMTKFMKAKKGAISVMDLGYVAIGLISGVLLLAIAAIVLAAFQTAQTANSLPYNITQDGLTLLKNTTAQFGTVGIIFGVAVLLGAVGLMGVGGYMAYKKARE